MIEVNRHTLSNGLKIIHNHDASTAMVALNVLYNTGARDEKPHLTGIAHLYEHLMFGGSANVPDFDMELTEAGGTNNAWTSNDFTSFWDIAPAHNAETMFHLESDRMLWPSLTQQSVDIQKSVVIEEFKQQCLGRPYGRTAHHLRRMLYPETHPYSWPVIGITPDHVAAATQTDMRKWWQDHYRPSNAILAVAGNITFGRTIELAEKWFGDIPDAPSPTRNFPEIPNPDSPKFTEIADNVPATMITMAWLTDPYGTEDYYAADAITDILAAGKASRFYRQLIVDGPGWFAEADASVTGAEHRGMLMVNLRLANENINIKQAIDYVRKQLKDLSTSNLPTAHEVSRIKNRQNSLYVLGNLDCLSRVQTIAMAQMHNEDPDHQLRQYMRLTPEKIARVARKIFTESHPAILITRPASEPENPS